MRASTVQKLRASWPAVGILAALALVYFPALSAGLFFDDHDVLFFGAKFFSLKKTLAAFVEFERPLLHLSYALDYRLSGLSPFGYHLTNVILHGANALLFLVFCRQLAERFKVSAKFVWLPTLFFALHPVHTEAVTYVAGRSSSLAAFFVLASLISFLRAEAVCEETAARRTAWIWTAVSILFFVLGLLTKEEAATVPLLIGIFIWLARSRKSIRFGIPFLVLGIVGIILKRGFIVSFFQAGDSWHYALTQPGVICRYLGLLFWPRSLNLDHDVTLLTDPREMAFWLPFLGILAWIGLAIFLRKRRPLVAFGMLWFLVALLPTSSFIPIPDAMAERRLYLAGIGIWLALWGLLPQKKSLPWVILWIAAVSVLGYLTYSRNLLYQDGVKLWADVIAKSPRKPRGYINLGSTLLNLGRLQEAERVFRKAYEMKPRDPALLGNLGKIAWDKGQVEEALQYYRLAYESAPRDAMVAYNYGKVLLETGATEQAQTLFETVMRLEPEQVYGHFGQGLVFDKQGNLPGARQAYERALSKDPCFADALTNLANLDYQQGIAAAALARYGRAISCEPEHGFARLNRAQVLLSMGRLEDAWADFLWVHERFPQAFLPTLQLATIATAKRDAKGARYWADKASQLAQSPEEKQQINQLLSAL